MTPAELNAEKLSDPGGKYPTFQWFLARVDEQKLDVNKVIVEISDLEGKVDKQGLEENVENRFKVTVSTGNKVAAGADFTWRTVSWATAEVPYSKKQKYSAQKPSGAQPSERIVIGLCNVKPTLQQPAALSVEVTLDGTEKKLDFQLAPDEPKIEKFRAEPSIIHTNRKTTLQWACDSGIKLSKIERDKEIPIQVSQSDRQKPDAPGVDEGRVTYKLTATKNNVTRVAATTVKVVNTSQWQRPLNGWDSEDQLTGLCLSPDGDTLYAIVRSKSKGGLLYSTTDGFSSWKELCFDKCSNWGTVSPARQSELTTVPVAALQLNSQPVLVFAGGSKIEYGYDKASNAVSLLRLGDERWEDHAANWKPRAGHVCVVTHEGGSPKIWVIGGLGRYGNPLNDAWVSADGVKWTNPLGKEEPWLIADWQGRGLFGATVKEEMRDGEVTKSEIWLGGGFQRPDGGPCNDLGYIDARARTYTPEYPTLMPDGYPSGLALAVLRKDLYAAGTYKTSDALGNIVYGTIFDTVKRNPEGKLALTRSKREDWSRDWRQSKVEAVGFNGCVWVCSLRLENEPDQVETSDLYYRVLD